MRGGDQTGLHDVHIGNHSNSTRQNNTSHAHDKIRDNTSVKNLSSTSLTEDQTKALAHGPNFAIVPRSPPVGEYIVAIENACNQLQQGKAEELRGEMKSVLKKIQAPKYNITREERKAIEELRRDKTRIILTMDKGVSMVVMDRDDYNKEAEELLHQPAYRPISNDPTNKYKTKLISLLKSIKTEGQINESTHKRLYPTWAGSPKFYGLPKVHKEGTPLRPIVSSTWAVTYSTSKIFSRILKPLVGKSPHHIHNNQDFMEHLKGIQLGPDEVMVSYGMRARSTSVPIKPALDVIEKLLKEDTGLQNRTSMSTKHIIDLLEFYLRSTYFTYRGNFYEQVEGAAMGSPISPIVANLYMESFEVKALQSLPNSPSVWKRFVDDTFVIMKKAHKEEFLTHLNSVDSNIQFTTEEPRPDGSLPFLDILVTPDKDDRLNTTAYRKPTHTDQYLHWDSHHAISVKYSVVGTLHHRAKTICFNNQLLQQEEEHLQEALMNCNYPIWALNRVK